jgi:hypothetical protein
MPSYTVELAAEKKRLPAKGDYSEKIIYDVLFSDGTTAELFQNVETAAPAKGDVLEGTIEPSKFGGGMTFRKDKTGFSGGSGGGKKGYEEWPPAHERDPYKDACIITTSAIKAAINLLAVEVAAGTSLKDVKATDLLRPRVDYFFKMIKEAGEAAENHAKTKPDLS